MSRAWKGLLVVAGLATLVACSTNKPAPGSAGNRDLPTVSDQTNADKRAQVRLELAGAYFSRGQTATALDEVKLALAAKPDMPEALNLRGLIYAALGEARFAEDSFKRAQQLAPVNGDVMHNYGWFLCQERRFDEAEAQFRQALAQPTYLDTVRTLLGMGVCQARAGKLAEAEATLTRAYEIDPSNPVSAFSLGDVLYRRGEYERVRFYMRRVNAISSQANAQSLWLAARAEQRLGNFAGAQQLGNQLRDRFPQSPEAVQFDRGRFDD